MSKILDLLRYVAGHKRLRVGLLFSARFSNPILSLVFSLIATRSLSLEGHGIYAKNFAWIVVVQALLEMGLTNSLVRFLSPALKAGRQSEVHAIVRASLQLKLYALLLLGGLTFAYAMLAYFAPDLIEMGVPAWLVPHESPEQLYIYWLVFTGGFGLSLLTYMDSVLVAKEDFLRIFLWVPSVGLIRLLLLAFFLSMEPVTPEHVLFAFAIGPYLSLMVFFLVFPGAFFLVRAGRNLWKPWVGKLLRFNSWILLAAFFAISSDWMEVLVINLDEDNGIYNAARLPMQAFMILLTTMVSLLMPGFSHLKDLDEFKAYFARIYRYLLPALPLFVPGLFVFPWFILAFYGDSYQTSVDVFYILYPSFILRIYAAPFGIALFALDQPRLIAVEAGLRMLSGVLFVKFLYMKYGVLGAAWGNLLSQCMGWSFLAWCYVRYFQGRPFPFAKKELVRGT